MNQVSLDGINSPIAWPYPYSMPVPPVWPLLDQRRKKGKKLAREARRFVLRAMCYIFMGVRSRGFIPWLPVFIRG